MVIIIPDPNNIVFPDYKLAFMCIAKNANSSVKRALMVALGIPEQVNVHDPRLFLYTQKAWIDAQQDWLKVAVIRNPYDRIASCWRQKVMHKEKLHSGFTKFKEIYWKQPFNEFIEAVSNMPDWKSDQHFRSQTADLCIGGGLVPNRLALVAFVFLKTIPICV